MSLKNLNTRRLHADRAMPIRVYNTLTRKKEEFVPLHANRVSMFVCGLTPQDETHMGHAKTYVAFDVVARFLRHKGYHLFYLQNVTDIEDRIIEKMQKTGRGWKDIVNQYFGEYLEVMDALRCNSVDVYAFATDYIDDIIEQIQGLIQKGDAYVAEDGSVYYDTTTFSGWGKLSGQKVESLRPGARIAIEERKRHPADFVLWRAQKPGEPGWDSPWGKGRPGWHIEDTAITIRHFGPQYDLHGGATELMFPHHEAEIAQAEGLTGKKPLAKYWAHTGLLSIKGQEMHKSLGNFVPIQDAIQKVGAEALRVLYASTHYRSPLDYTEETLVQAASLARRFRRAYDQLQQATGAKSGSNVANDPLKRQVNEARTEFFEA